MLTRLINTHILYCVLILVSVISLYSSYSFSEEEKVLANIENANAIEESVSTIEETIEEADGLEDGKDWRICL